MDSRQNLTSVPPSLTNGFGSLFHSNGIGHINPHQFSTSTQNVTPSSSIDNFHQLNNQLNLNFAASQQQELTNSNFHLPNSSFGSNSFASLQNQSDHLDSNESLFGSTSHSTNTATGYNSNYLNLNDRQIPFSNLSRQGQKLSSTSATFASNLDLINNFDSNTIEHYLQPQRQPNTTMSPHQQQEHANSVSNLFPGNSSSMSQFGGHLDQRATLGNENSTFSAIQRLNNNNNLNVDLNFQRKRLEPSQQNFKNSFTAMPAERFQSEQFQINQGDSHASSNLNSFSSLLSPSSAQGSLQNLNQQFNIPNFDQNLTRALLQNLQMQNLNVLELQHLNQILQQQQGFENRLNMRPQQTLPSQVQGREMLGSNYENQQQLLTNHHFQKKLQQQLQQQYQQQQHQPPPQIQTQQNEMIKQQQNFRPSNPPARTESYSAIVAKSAAKNQPQQRPANPNLQSPSASLQSPNTSLQSPNTNSPASKLQNQQAILQNKTINLQNQQTNSQNQSTIVQNQQMNLHSNNFSHQPKNTIDKMDNFNGQFLVTHQQQQPTTANKDTMTTDPNYTSTHISLQAANLTDIGNFVPTPATAAGNLHITNEHMHRMHVPIQNSTIGQFNLDLEIEKHQKQQQQQHQMQLQRLQKPLDVATLTNSFAATHLNHNNNTTQIASAKNYMNTNSRSALTNSYINNRRSRYNAENASPPHHGSATNLLGYMGLYVGNLSPDLTKEQLEKIFAKYGEPVKAHRLLRSPVAFIKYDNTESPRAAIEDLYGVLLPEMTLNTDQPLKLHFDRNDAQLKANYRPTELPPKADNGECYAWRTTVCRKGKSCTKKHIPINRGIDFQMWMLKPTQTATATNNNTNLTTSQSITLTSEQTA